MKLAKLLLISISVICSIVIDRLPMTIASEKSPLDRTSNSLLSDPFLQLPTANTVNVVWFTEFAGDKHWVEYGTQFKQQVLAKTTKLSRVREDKDSQIPTRAVSSGR